MLAKRFESSFIFENVYFAKPLLDERVLAQDVDSSLAAVALRQREWVRQESTSAIESVERSFNNINVWFASVVEGRRRSA